MTRSMTFGAERSSLLDESVLADLWTLCETSGRDFLVQSVRLFEQRSRQCEGELDFARASADRDMLRKTAHALAGTAAMVGALQLHDRVAELETNTDLAWDEVGILLNEVHALCDGSRRALWQEVMQ